MSRCPRPSYPDDGTSEKVHAILGQITSDISFWGGNTGTALVGLENVLRNLEDFNTTYNFSPNVNAEPAEFTYEAPELEPNFEYDPQDLPEYDGPLQFDPANPDPFAPTTSITPVGTFTPYVFRPPDRPVELSPPPPPERLTVTYNPPTGAPKGISSKIDPYRAPGWNPDIGVLGFREGSAPTFSGVSLSPTNIPAAPTVTTPTVADPTAPTIYSPQAITWQDPGGRPIWDGVKPTLDFSGEPGGYAGSPAPSAPSITDVIMPTYSGPDDPVEPVLADITIPVIRDVILPSFEIPVSQDEIPSLNVGFDYNDPGYSDTQIDELRTEISRVLNGDLGIPAYLWDAIWDKASTQIQRAGVQRERQGRQTWAKLGWSMPGGVALAQAEQAAHDINEQLNEKAREMAVQRATMEREDFWQAVQHGVSFQTMMIGLYNAFQERQLRAEVALVEALVNVHNAAIAKYNAELQRVQSLVAITELKLKGALASLEVDKARLDGAKVTAEINQQLVQVYTAQWEGVKAAVQKFATLVDAKKTELDAQRLRVEVFSALVKSRMTEVEAWSKEWDGYVAKVEGQKAKAQVYDIEARAFSELMKGYGIGADVEKARVDSTVQTEKLQLEHSSLQLQRYATDWQSVATKLDTMSKTISARVQAYGTEAQTTVAQNGNQIEGEKARVQAYGAEVQGFAAEMSNIGAKAQAIATIYRAEADKFQAISQGSLAVVQASAEKVKAEATAADADARAYVANVEGKKAEMEGDIKQAEVDLQKYRVETEVAKSKADNNLAIYDALIKNELAQIQSKDSEYRVKGIQAQAEGEAMRAEAAAYSAEMETIRSENQAQVSIAQAYASAMSAQASVAGANAQNESARIDAEAKLTDAKVRAALGEAEVDKLRVQSAAINLEADIKRAELEQQAMIEEAKVAIQKLIGMTQIQVQGLQGIAQTYAALCSGAYSAANVSAGIRSDVSHSASLRSDCSESHSFSYETA